jgi:hypothetical protein
VHDHPRPEAKSTSEARRSLGAGRRVRGLAVLLAREAALGSKVISSVTRKFSHLRALLMYMKCYNLHSSEISFHTNNIYILVFLLCNGVSDSMPC